MTSVRNDQTMIYPTGLSIENEIPTPMPSVAEPAESTLHQDLGALLLNFAGFDTDHILEQQNRKDDIKSSYTVFKASQAQYNGSDLYLSNMTEEVKALFNLTKYNFIYCNQKCLSHNDFIDAGADVCHVDHVQSEKDPITDMMLEHTASSIHKEFIPIVKLTRMLDEDDTGAQVHS